MKRILNNMINAAKQPFHGCVFHIQEPHHPSHDYRASQRHRKEYIVGRLTQQSTFETTQIQLRDQYVSRVHCRLFWVSCYGWMVEDLNSSNGTWVRQVGDTSEEAWKRVHKPVRLGSDSEIKIGCSQLNVNMVPVHKPAAWTPRKVALLNHL